MITVHISADPACHLYPFEEGKILVNVSTIELSDALGPEGLCQTLCDKVLEATENIGLQLAIGPQKSSSKVAH
jgi:hypothetical protein